MLTFIEQLEADLKKAIADSYQSKKKNASQSDDENDKNDDLA